MTLNDKNELLGEVLISAIKKPIYQAAEKILNLAIYQLGSEKMLAYKEKLEHVSMRFKFSSNSEPLLSRHWYQDISEHIRDKDIVLPILAHGILRPECKNDDYGGSFSKNHYFGGMLHVIQKVKNNNDLDGYFATARSCDSVCFTITSHWPLKSEVYQELNLWLTSEDVANIVINIDSTRYDHVASNDLCDALGLLHIKNDYINCEVREL